MSEKTMEIITNETHHGRIVVGPPTIARFRVTEFTGPDELLAVMRTFYIDERFSIIMCNDTYIVRVENSIPRSTALLVKGEDNRPCQTTSDGQATSPLSPGGEDDRPGQMMSDGQATSPLSP